MQWRTRIGRWGGAMLPGEAWMRWTFLLLLAVAATLRCWRLWHMPYMHDELSALVRLYPTLWETIQRGVIELDTHPPGVQVFEWLWTRLFGSSEFAVKLPFVLMGLGALPLLYRTAMAWTSATTALLLTALLATLQYSVLYGQLARPYAAGLFTTALFADQLTRWLAQPQRKQLIWMGVAALLSAYTHHFALLLVGLMGLSGLLLATPEQRRPYLIMAAVVLVGYLPNVPIFLHQLGQGGLSEWLAAPDERWLLDHAWWVAHYSWWLAAPLLALVLWATIRKVMHREALWPAFPLLLLWGLAPMLLGLAYSVWRAPVLQHSVLLFSFPYLAMALLLGLGELGRVRTMVLCGVFALLATGTLIHTRQHYGLLYHSKYEAMVQRGVDAIAEHGPNKVAVFFDAAPEVIEFYLKQWAIAPETLPYVQLREQGYTPERLDSLLNTLDQELLVYGQSNGAPNEQLARIQLHFPWQLERQDLAEGQVFLLGREPSALNVRGVEQVSHADPQSGVSGTWEIHNDLPVVKSLGSFVGPGYWDYSGREFGILTRMLLDTVVRKAQDQVEIRVHLGVSEGVRNVGVVVELKHADSTLFYRTAELGGPVTEPYRLQTLVVAARRGDAHLLQGPVELVAYVHNRDKAMLHVFGMDVQLRAANPVVYGITGPIDGEWVYRPD
jgi:hypothetical protein